MDLGLKDHGTESEGGAEIKKDKVSWRQVNIKSERETQRERGRGKSRKHSERERHYEYSICH